MQDSAWRVKLAGVYMLLKLLLLIALACMQVNVDGDVLTV